MKELKPRIHENGMNYVLVGDYYVPDLKLPEEHRPMTSMCESAGKRCSPFMRKATGTNWTHTTRRTVF